jgi:hypothetical protein
MGICQTSLLIIKTTMRFHLIPVRMASVKKRTGAGGECKLAQVPWEFLENLTLQPPCDSDNSLYI